MSVGRGSLTASQRVERDRRIAEARSAGVAWKEIADAEGVSVATAKRSAQAHGPVLPMTLADLDADEILLRVVRSHLAMLGVAERMVVADGLNENARVGALRVASTLGEKTLQVLALTGLLRGYSGLERFHAELRAAAVGMCNLAERHGIPLDEVEAAFVAAKVPSHIAALGVGEDHA